MDLTPDQLDAVAIIKQQALSEIDAMESRVNAEVTDPAKRVRMLCRTQGLRISAQCNGSSSAYNLVHIGIDALTLELDNPKRMADAIAACPNAKAHSAHGAILRLPDKLPFVGGMEFNGPTAMAAVAAFVVVGFVYYQSVITRTTTREERRAYLQNLISESVSNMQHRATSPEVAHVTP